MIHDVVSAIYRGEYKIELEFDDGARGVADFSRYVGRSGVFERFKDMEFFRNFFVDNELGVIRWGDEVDIAPETLYAEATGSALPEWMKPEQAASASQCPRSDAVQPSAS